MAVLQYKDPVTGQLKDLPLINQGIKEAPIDGKQYARKDGEWSEIEVDGNVDLSGYTTNEELNNALLGKVDKQEGKQLTTEDFTTVLKEKLEGLSNYNDTEIRNAIDSLESAFNTLVEGNATVAIDTFNEIVAFLKNIENSQDLDSIIAGINTTISKVEAKIPDTNNLLSKDGGTMNNTNLVGNLNAELLNGYSSDKFVSIINHFIDNTTTDASTVGLNTINQDYLWTNTPYSDIATLVDISYSPDWRSLFFISPSTKRIHTRFKYNGDSWSDWKEIAFTDGSVANADMLDGYHESAFLRYRGETGTDQESTLWNSLGIKQYSNALPDGLTGVYNYGEVISLPGSSARFDMYVAHTTTNTDVEHGIWVRSGWGDDKKPWRRLAFTDDPVAAANKLSTTRYLWGQSFDGSGNVNGVMNFLSQGNLITVGGESWANNIVLSTGYDATNGDWTKLGVAGSGSNSAGLILTYHGRVGIGTLTPVSELHVVGRPIFNHNGQHGDSGLVIIRNDASITGWDRAIFAHYPNLEAGAHANFHIGKADSEKNGGYISYYHAGDSSGNNCMTIGLYATDDILNVTANRRVGINTTTPQEALDVNGDAIIRGSLHTMDHILLDGTDQINGKWGGITLNYSSGKYVDTSIFDGQAHQIMRVFGEGRRVAIGPSAIESPQGRLNVDGDVVFENSRFITTSGFTDGEYAYSHAIYGGYHGIDVCEFYENEFRFKTNGGDTTSFTLNRYYADFNGTVRTHNCNFVGIWNGIERFRLIRSDEVTTWLQAATDTTSEGGKLLMSGMYGTHLSEFNVLATTSNFKGSIIAEGDVTSYSDIRLKNRMESVNNVLDTIYTLDVFRYTWKDSEDKSVHIGVSAQQVQTIYPEFVLTSNSEDGTDYLTVNYAALATCIAIQGIKELVKKGDERDKRIAALEEEVISLKEQLRYGNK